MWILFALTSATILASRKIQEKKLVGGIGPVMGWMIRVGSVAMTFVIWVVFSRSLVGLDSPYLWWMLLYCVFAYPLLIILYYRALHDLPFSLFGMMAPIVPITALIGSWIVFGQTPSLAGFIGIGAISIGIVALFYKHENKEIKLSSLFYALLAYMVMGIGSVGDKIALNHVSPDLYSFLNQMTALISLFLFSFIYFRGPHISFYKKNLKTLSFVGFTQGIGYVLVMLAISVAPNPGYVVALSNTHAILTTLYGIFILKEKITKRKVFVFLCMMGALIAFAFA